MKNQIVLLVDYLGQFGSKHNASVHWSGMDICILEKYFNELGYSATVMGFPDVLPGIGKHLDSHTVFLYTSSEDAGFLYKDYIEDVIYYLELSGYRVIPGYQYLRANNNKVFMEFLRSLHQVPGWSDMETRHFGTFEEFQKYAPKLQQTTVLKKARGAMSRGVFLVKPNESFIKNVREVSRSRYPKAELWEWLRWIKYPGYRRRSKYRNKFISQRFIEGLDGDWKILAFGNKYYSLYRRNRKGDFRASGSGLWSQETAPKKILDYAKQCFEVLSVPNLSMDISYVCNQCQLIEFQAVYYGPTTMEISKFYYDADKEWEVVTEDPILEREYASSIVQYLERSR